MALLAFAIRSGKYNLKCILAPGIAMTGLFVLWLGAELADKFPNVLRLENTTRAIAFVIFTAAVGCAFLGLIEYFKLPKRSSKRAGARYAVTTIVLGSMAFMATGLSLYTKKAYGQGNFIKVLLAPKLIRNFAFRFQIGQPEDWFVVDGSRLKPAAAVAFTRVNPSLSFALTAQNPGPGTPAKIEEFVEQSKKQLEANNSSVDSTEATVGGDANGQSAVFESQVVQGVFTFFYVHHLVLSNGIAYQLVTWGPANDPNTVRSQAEKIFSTFAVLR